MSIIGIDVGVARDTENNRNVVRIRLRDGWFTCGTPLARFLARQITEAADYIDPADHEAPFNFHAHLARQADWSFKTFGPGDRAKGVVDHIRKELLEIEQAPGDLEEWIDVVILALDGAWRSGATPEQIITALVAKQAKNEKRKWPDWRTADPGKAIEHVKGAKK